MHPAMLALSLSAMSAQPPTAEEPAQSSGATAADSPSTSGPVSLADVAPELYYALRRYPKFYGDDNTIHGGPFERAYLLDDMFGSRDELVSHGIYFDAALTQFLQSVVSGGKDEGPVRYNGSLDYWLTLDAGKAGLWAGGAVFSHAETSWQAARSVNRDVGALVPANQDATMPTPGESESMALPELYLAQAFPDDFVLLIGKVDWAGVADTNGFANNERTQFLNTSLVNNPILGVFAPYTSLGLAATWAPPGHALSAFVFQNNGNGTTSGFDNFDGEYTYGLQYQFSPKIGDNLPGNYRLILGYTDKDLPNFDISPSQLIGELGGSLPIAEKSENYTALLNFDQYVWVEDDDLATRGVALRHLPPRGVGVFGRAGWAPEDRNVIDQFYSVGIGGCGTPIPGRRYDNWGMGWSGTLISDDLRDDAGLLQIDLNGMEQAVEVFYDFELTRAVHLTLDTQVIDPAVRALDTAVVIGVRLQVDF